MEWHNCGLTELYLVIFQVLRLRRPLGNIIMTGTAVSYVFMSIVAALVFSMLLIVRNSDTMKSMLTTAYKTEDLEIVPTPKIVASDVQAPATTGKLFKGDPVAVFDKNEARFAFKPSFQKSSNLVPLPKMFDTPCKHWSVLTTIFEPTSAAAHQAELEGWCFVVVGDKSSISDSYVIESVNSSKVVFLNVAKQVELAKSYSFVDMLPWKSFTRKNIGYLYAIINHAESIWDFDDDNLLISTGKEFSVPTMGVVDYSKDDISKTVRVFEASNVPSLGFNPYPLMGATTSPCWPRGYPLDHIKENVSEIVLSKRTLNFSTVGIVQSLANHDPDVDAIYRLTQPLPFNFDTSIAKTKDRILAIPAKHYAPYNAQATWHLYPSLWSMLLPHTVHGRVADIWRGYMFQRLAQDIGIRLLMAPAMVVQDRNSHAYLADFDSEEQLYKRATRLLEQLSTWEATSTTFPGRIEELWIFMYEHGYLGKADVYLVQSWLQSLIDCGYRFPELVR
jgi:hypothetical protein